MGVELLELIRERSEKSTEHNYGILTADRYVSSIQDCIGSDLCYRYASKSNTSFSDVMTKAAKTLTYNNPDTTVKAGFQDAVADAKSEGLELPKNTLMAFKHVLTSTRKDRDGDVLHSDGAKLDENMLLLWQHVHTLPIGKCLGVANKNKNRLSVYSAIVDLNDLSHDAAVMVDNGMGRFSHGFKALEFNKLKEEGGKTSGGPGFEVVSYEVMEESLVSVPSNVDSVTEEVIVELVEGKRLTSGIMKSMGTRFREKMPLRVPVTVDLKLMLDGKEIENGTIEAKGSSGGCGCGCGVGKGEACTCGTSEKDDDKSSGRKEGVESTDDDQMKCPKCGKKMVDGVCDKCGYGMTNEKEEEEDKSIDDDLIEKVGRSLSSKNISALKEIRGFFKELDEREFAMSNRGRGYCKKCMKMIDDMVGGPYEHEEERAVEPTVKDLLAGFVLKADKKDRGLAIDILNQMQEDDRKARLVSEVANFIRS